MKYIYYSGCALKASGKPYEESLHAVLKKLDVPFEELKDWNCCGATTYMSIDEMKAFALAGRNLAMAEHQNGSTDVHLMAPCSACYLVLTKAQNYINTNAAIGAKVRQALSEVGLNYEGKATIRHPLDILVNDVGLERIKKEVKRQLKGLRVVSYYGCQIVRPFKQFDDPRDPMTMDALVKTLGATPVDWALKTRCCGGNLINTIHEVGLRLSFHLLKEAERLKADVMLTVCPLCQFNLECYRKEMETHYGERLNIPVIYFTQLLGLALGIPERELGLHRSLLPLTYKQKLGKEELVYA
jgi:heterodisulfide reductase subunit B